MNFSIDQFQKEGYCTNITLLGKSESINFLEDFNNFITKNNYENKKIKRELHNRHFDNDFIWNIATNKKLLDVVEEIIGPNILLIGSRFVCKWENQRNFSPWHQDSKYQKLYPSKQVTVWYAVDNSNEENGCLYVIPRTHKQGYFEHYKEENSRAQVFNGIKVTEKQIQESVPLILNKGTYGIFHGDIIHGSPENNSSHRRCGLVLRYIPTSVKPEVEGMWPAILVRGENKEKNFPNLTIEEGANFKYITK